jgi:hypothetical protein
MDRRIFQSGGLGRRFGKFTNLQVRLRNHNIAVILATNAAKCSPGRWHGALVIKMVVVEVLKNFDFRLEDENQRTHFWWETFQMPYESTRVVFSKTPLM